ncbi:hypothetical protein Tco_1259362 [Tanacetum coccineum]
MGLVEGKGRDYPKVLLSYRVKGGGNTPHINVIKSAKYYNDVDWSDIMGQVHANTGLTADLLGPDVNEDNFAARMAAIIAERRRKFAAQRFQDKINKPMTYAQQRDYMRTFVKNQSSTIYTIGWTLKHVRSFSDDWCKEVLYT